MKLGALDSSVLVAYALGMLAVGWYFARRTKSMDDYLLGGRRMRSGAVGLSLFASLLSAISYLSYPEEMILRGPMVLAGSAAYPLVIFVVGWILIPRLMREEVTTAYELLDRRLGPSVRFAGSFLFLALRLIWMAFIIHLLAMELVVPILGLSPSAAVWVSAIVGLLTVVYTALGGLRAVVYTDVIQTLILFGGAVAAIAIIHGDRGGVDGWWPSGWAEHWAPLRFFPDAEDPGARTILGAGLAYFCWHVCTAGSDQVAIQRYLATKDARAARRAYVTSLTADLTTGLCLGVLGLCLLAYFAARPELLPDGKPLSESTSGLFLAFIVSGLPAGLTGLVVAALLAAAMSSLSSGLNSTSSVVAIDFFQRFRPRERSETDRVRLARRISWGIGFVIVGLSLVIGEIDQEGNLLQRVHKTVNLLVAPLFVLFFMALFVPWATAFGTLLGCAVSIFVAVAVSWQLVEINFLWLMPLSLVSGGAIGIIFSHARPGHFGGPDSGAR